jgi:ketosteroid isomerase-like protein
MSQENVRVVRRVQEEFRAGVERGDPGAFFDLETVADDYEWVDLLGDVYRGRDEFVGFLRDFLENFEEWSFQEQLIDAGDDRVVSIGLQRGTGKGSGVPVEWRYGQIFELESGRLIRARVYLSHDEALEAAGLSE